LYPNRSAVSRRVRIGYAPSMSDDNNADITGSCVCGGVRYALTRPTYTFQYCFCSRCRKGSGAAHATNLFVVPDQFRWLDGEELVKRFDLPTAKYWSRCFCSTCGSSLPWLSRTGKMMIVPAGTLDDDPVDRPLRNIYFGSRSPWYVSPSELETHEESPKRS
jgi:hypothetical protein